MFFRALLHSNEDDSSSEELQEKKGENAKVSVTEIAKILGARWKAMSDEDKARYLTRYHVARSQYMEAMEEYRAKK